MRIPGENSMQRIVLDHMSRDIWVDVLLLYNMLWLLGTMPPMQQFKVSISLLLREGYLERRKNYVGSTDTTWPIKYQYRLTEEASGSLPKIRRGRHMGSKPAANCNWFKPFNQRLRSVV